jgi:uncharacterized protein (TIGR02246 family)
MSSPMRRAIALAVLAVTASIAGVPAHAAPETPDVCAGKGQGAEQVAMAWQEALMRNDADAIAVLYAQDARLVSSDPTAPLHAGRKAIRDYYADLVERHPRAAHLDRVTLTGCERVIETGTVTFRVTGRRKGTRMLVGGKFSATYALREGAWQIVSHALETQPLAYERVLPGWSETFGRH